MDLQERGEPLALNGQIPLDFGLLVVCGYIHTENSDCLGVGSSARKGCPCRSCDAFQLLRTQLFGV